MHPSRVMVPIAKSVIRRTCPDLARRFSRFQPGTDSKYTKTEGVAGVVLFRHTRNGNPTDLASGLFGLIEYSIARVMPFSLMLTRLPTRILEASGAS
jgi:hypothetical protein